MASTSGTVSQPETNIHRLKPDQVEAMSEAAYGGRHGHRDEAVVTVLYDTNPRRTGFAQVNRDMLNFEDELLRIPAVNQKDHPNNNSSSATTFELDPSG